MVKNNFFIIAILLITAEVFLNFAPLSAQAASHSWVYPLLKYSERPSFKHFGQYISPDFYIGREDQFPAKFTGYHTGVDLEIFDNEQSVDVPVYAVTSGTISFVGSIQGYGGVILEKITDPDITVLYGHVKTANLTSLINTSVAAGQQITVLGDAFSSSTGGERKHLHLGMYKGGGQNFAGYTSSAYLLNSQWLDPNQILYSHTAQALSTPTPLPSPDSAINLVSPSNKIISAITAFINRLFNLGH